MLQPFDLQVLLFPGAVIFIVTLTVAIYATHAPATSLFAAVFKAAAFVVYFGFIFDGTYTFLDDWTYLQGTDVLYSANVGLTSLADNWDLVAGTADGEHFLYYLYSTYAFRLFGNGYFAPVALNVVTTVFIALIGWSLGARTFGFQGGERKYFFLFLLFYPDILAWSNVMNGKDMLVLLFHLLLLYGFAYYFEGRIFRAATVLVAASAGLLFLRFYVPLLFAFAFLASAFMAAKGRQRVQLIVAGIVLLGAALVAIGSSMLEYASGSLGEHFVNPVVGLIRFLLSPVPFGTDPEYAFLNFSSLIHWVMIPVAIVGLARVYQLNTAYSRFFLFYVLIFVTLYSFYGELQGPRHRIQLDYAWAIFHFWGLLSLVKTSAPKSQVQVAVGRGA